MHVRLDLVPEDQHDTFIAAGLYTQEECKSAHVPACYVCSEAVTHYFTSIERARYLTNPHTLKDAMSKIGWIK